MQSMQYLTSRRTLRKTMKCPNPRGRRILDLSGERFGWLVAIKYHSSYEDYRGRLRHKWECQCDCGNTKVVKSGVLIKGDSLSCGCVAARKESRVINYHKMSGTKAYNSWTKMMERCLNPESRSYKWYGGRGILICERWADFRKFYADMGDPPSPIHSIGRIDNDGNYEPSNCRWETPSQQGKNKRGIVWLTIGNKTQTIRQWSAEYGISENVVSSRKSRGWPLNEGILIKRTPSEAWSHSVVTGKRKIKS